MTNMQERATILIWIKEKFGLVTPNTPGKVLVESKSQPIDRDTALEIDKKFGHLSEQSRTTSGPRRIG